MKVVEAAAERIELLHGDVHPGERDLFAARERFDVALHDQPRIRVQRIGAAADPQPGSIRLSAAIAQYEQRTVDVGGKTRDPPLQRELTDLAVAHGDRVAAS